MKRLMDGGAELTDFHTHTHSSQRSLNKDQVFRILTLLSFSSPRGNTSNIHQLKCSAKFANETAPLIIEGTPHANIARRECVNEPGLIAPSSAS
jgi:hypothetical protein